MIENTQLLLYQFTSGCDRINCSNKYCFNNPKFIYSHLDEKEKYNQAIQLQNEPEYSEKLCKHFPYNVTNPECKDQLEIFRNFALNFIDQYKINTKEIITQIRKNFLDKNIFGLILLDNDKPLSIFNSAINDNFLYDFSTKLSSIPHLNASVFDCINSITKTLLESRNQNAKFNKFTKLRSLLILFYFPAILNPHCFKTILYPLLERISAMSKATVNVFIHWLSKLPKLFSQIIGAVHFAISIYFCTHRIPNMHSDELSIYLKVFTILYESNSLSDDPFAPSFFYNHHINEFIDYERELNRNRNDLPSLLNTPCVLSIKTKAAICQIESEQFMQIVAYRAIIMNVFGNSSNNDIFLTLRIRRDHLIDDAVSQLLMQNSLNFLKKLRIVFEGESAVDVGGPSREFLYLVSEQLFSPDHGMFITINDNRYHWFSQCSFEDDRSFFLAGAVVGLAIHNSVVLPIRFPHVIYKRLLTPAKELTINDLKEVDPQVASSLSSIAQMAQNGEDVSALMLNFTAQVDVFGEKVTLPLVDGMQDIDVENENVDLYISSYINFILVKSIGQEHFDSFRRGFELACKSPSYRLLDPAEIDLLVSGEDQLDWEALKRAAIYKDGYNEQSRSVRWFWEIFDGFSTKEKLMFLKFATGTDRAPIGGLGNLKLIIQKGADANRLPVSHTCFNTFTLPNYKTKKQMIDNVKLAIQHTEGFGFI